jgi:hypothetical protein
LRMTSASAALSALVSMHLYTIIPAAQARALRTLQQSMREVLPIRADLLGTVQKAFGAHAVGPQSAVRQAADVPQAVHEKTSPWCCAEPHIDPRPQMSGLRSFAVRQFFEASFFARDSRHFLQSRVDHGHATSPRTPWEQNWVLTHSPLARLILHAWAHVHGGHAADVSRCIAEELTSLSCLERLELAIRACCAIGFYWNRMPLPLLLPSAQGRILTLAMSRHASPLHKTRMRIHADQLTLSAWTEHAIMRITDPDECGIQIVKDVALTASSLLLAFFLCAEEGWHASKACSMLLSTAVQDSLHEFVSARAFEARYTDQLILPKPRPSAPTFLQWLDDTSLKPNSTKL